MMGERELSNKLIRKFELNHEKINAGLEKYVKEEMERDKGLGLEKRHSNIGGWHSDRELHAKLGEDTPSSHLLLKLFDSFTPPMNEYINHCHEFFGVKAAKAYFWDYTGAWFNVAFKGSYNAPHIHPGDQISAAYYVRAEDADKEHPLSGRVEFIHQNIQYGFFPKPGTLILFPSTMLHWVHPYYGSGLRICLSFNARNIQVDPSVK